MKMRFIPTSVHGAVDHVVGPALVLAPTLLRLGRTSPEGITARAVGGATLALVPVLTGARQRGKKHWLPHVAIGAMEIGMAAFTKTHPPRPAERRADTIRKLAKTALKAKVVKDVARALT